MKRMIPFLMSCLLIVSGGSEVFAQQKKYRIGIAGIQVENSTFSPVIAPTMRTTEGQPMMMRYPYLSPDSVMGQGAEWFPALIAGSGGSGVVARDAYEAAVNKAIEMIKANMPYDAFFYHIHGACSVEGLDDPEGIFLERIRRIIGNDALVSTSMDLHGSVTIKLLENTDLITTYRMAPHDDSRISIRRAVVNLWDRLTSGKGRPAYKAWVAVPILLPGEQSSTRMEPAKSLYAKVPEVEALPGVLDAGIWISYVWADNTRNQGVVVVVGDDKEQVGSSAKMLAETFWSVRHQFTFEAPVGTLDECLDIALKSNKKPFFISDMGDNPSGGGVGDVTWTLARLLKRPELQTGKGKTLIYASIPGPEMIEAAKKAGVGGQVEAKVGAILDNRYEGPVNLKGTVHFTGDNQAVIKAGSIYVIVTERARSFQSEEAMLSIGLKPREADMVMVKQGYLVPAWFNMKADWVMAHTRGAVDQDVANLPYKNIIRPMFPMDPDMPDPELNVIFVPSAKYKYGR
jgi:microcystin degradation protein MlrC